MTQILDKTGQRFGKLVIIELVSKERWLRWKCQCDCGKVIYALGTNLQKGQSSCGCIRYDGLASPFQVAVGKKFRIYKIDAEKAGRAWGLDIERFTDLVTARCYYCNSEPGSTSKTITRLGKSHTFKFNGIDRKDNAQGYHAWNVVPCCTICNMAKRSLTMSEFKEWTHKLAAHTRQMESTFAIEEGEVA